MSDPVTSQPEENTPQPSPEAAPPAPPEEKEDDFAALFAEGYATPASRAGEIVSGKVVALTEEIAVVSFGAREGQIPLKELTDEEGTLLVQVGEEIKALLEREGGEGERDLLSAEKARKIERFDEIMDACERGELLTGKIVARVKGGLSVDVGLKAFLPGSRVDVRPVHNLDRFVGNTYQFQVIKFNRKRGNIVLSRRELAEKEQEEQKKKALARLQEGMILDGVIKNLTDYGAFVDLGGVDGLLHLTDMSWGRISHPGELFSVGDEVRVKVLRFSPDNERISLGVKQISDDPWSRVKDTYTEGKKVKGRVVSLTDYGAFVELEQGVEGLVHISEMSWDKKLKHPSKLVSVGDEVEVVILKVDLEAQRISLGMKQLMPNPWQLLKEKYPEGTRVTGKVRNLTNFGAFVNIEEGIDGLIHISDISWTVKVRHPSERFQKGDEVEAVVLHVDVERERLSLGFKQRFPDPWDRIPQEFTVGRILTGKVQKALPAGFVVELEPGVEGFLPLRELSEEPIEDPEKLPKEGDSLTTEIVRINIQERIVGLSVRSLARDENKSDYAAYMAQMAAQESTPKLGSLLKEKLGLKEEEKQEEQKGENVEKTEEKASEEQKGEEVEKAEEKKEEEGK